jgi:hypothetical protein
MKTIHDLGQRLIAIESRFKVSDANYNPWHTMWHGMIGALYSLQKALPLLPAVNEARDSARTTNQARKVLGVIAAARTPREKAYNSWFVGYHLNNADFRIGLSLHRVLKACYACTSHEDRRMVPALVTDILGNKRCNSCRVMPIALPRGFTRTLAEFKKYHDAKPGNRRRFLPTRGVLLVDVHFRVNGLKHALIPEVDKRPQTQRWREAYECLAEIYGMFGYVAEARDVLQP